jgi:cell division protease FtsH
VELKVLAARTAGFAGADLANLVNEAALLAARKNKPQVEMRDFDDAIDRVIAGLEKKRVMSPREREIVAYHEAGHAVVASCFPVSTRFTRSRSFSGASARSATPCSFPWRTVT